MGAALSRAVSAQAKALWAEFPAATRGDTRAVHRARVATRRLREALGVARAIAPGEDVARTAREVRRITRALGPVRELDVVLAALTEEPRPVIGTRDAFAFATRRLEALRVARRAELAAAIAAVDRPWLVQRLAAIPRALDATPAHLEWARVLEDRISHRARRVAKALGRCGTMYAPDRLHRARLAIKKLRYTLELAADAKLAVAGGGAIEALRVAQGRFGRLHDLQVLGGHVERLAGEVGRAALGKPLVRLATAVERACREEHAAMLPLLPPLAELAREVQHAGPEGVVRPVRMLRAGAASTRPSKRVAR